MKRKDAAVYTNSPISSSSTNTLSPKTDNKRAQRVTFSPLPRSQKEEEELTRMKQFHERIDIANKILFQSSNPFSSNNNSKDLWLQSMQLYTRISISLRALQLHPLLFAMMRNLRTQLNTLRMTLSEAYSLNCISTV